MEIKKATESQREEILSIHNQAFGGEKGAEIAKLVDDMLEDISALPILSLVATQDNKILGHVLFTKVSIEGTKRPISAQILAPLAVLPGEQNKGIGEKLINEGKRLLKERGTELLFVLGHPTYYPRCGFVPAGAKGFKAPYPIPEEHAAAWMILELNGNALETESGNVRCSDVLNEPQHWRE